MATEESVSATPAAAIPLEEAIRSAATEILKASAADSALGEDLALALLKRTDLTAEILEQLSKNGAVIKSRKVKRAIVAHPRTPRHLSIAIVRQLFTFDLMQIALLPVVAGDLKVSAEEALIQRLETISSGEKLSLARRASGRVAGKLLLDPELRIARAALENPRLTETLVIRGLTGPHASPAFVLAVCNHPKWSLRREIRLALLRHEKTPLGFALEFARGLPAPVLQEILVSSRLPQAVKAHCARLLR